MSINRLILRSATYHWRTNIAVSLGVAAAVAVLAARCSLATPSGAACAISCCRAWDGTGQVVSSMGYFRDALAGDVTAHGAGSAVPLIATRAFVTHEPSDRRAAGVLVYGGRSVLAVSRARATGWCSSRRRSGLLGVQPGDVLLTRLQKPSEIPIESLFAHKEDLGRTVRLTVTGTLRPAELGEFSLQPQQAEVRAVFAPLRRLQRDLGVERKVNTVLIGESTSEADGSRAFRSGVTLEDLGVEVSVVAGGTAVIVESASGVIGEALERAGREAARELNHAPVPVFACWPTPSASAIAKSRIAGQWHQSSRVVHLRAASPDTSAQTNHAGKPDLGEPLTWLSPDSIVLNEWTARELNAKPGDTAQLDFYLWDAAGG